MTPNETGTDPFTESTEMAASRTRAPEGSRRGNAAKEVATSARMSKGRRKRGEQAGEATLVPKHASHGAGSS